MIRIDSDTDIGMNRNSSDWLGMNSYPILSPGNILLQVQLQDVAITTLINIFTKIKPIFVSLYFVQKS